MRRLRFTDDARDNLVDIALNIASESQSREIAIAFVDRLRAKCRHLASLPATLGTARPDLHEDIRCTSCQGYVILFRYHGDVLDVVNVLHGLGILRGDRKSSLRAKRGNPVAMAGLDCRASLAMTKLFNA